MANISGRPFLWWLMTRLSRQQVGRVILSVGYKAEVMQDYFGGGFALAQTLIPEIAQNASEAAES
jgi:NDP-sugar pyrophosphorylase family protein